MEMALFPMVQALRLIWEAPRDRVSRRELIGKDERIPAVMLVENARLK
jgi:hypothetical protein